MLKEKEQISPEIQRAAIEAKIRADGAVIAPGHWIEELDETGRTFARKGVQRAIGLVRDGVVQRVYVWKYSRFGRNALGVGRHVQEMEKAGGQLVSATENVDASTAVGRLTQGMLWQLDEFYSDLIGEQWQEVHARRRRNGLPHSGRPRFGYLYHRTTTVHSRCPQGCGTGECLTRYVPDPALREEAAGMYDAYNSGSSVRVVAVSLNARGVMTTGGQPWDQVKVRKYLHSGFAAGLLVMHDPECDCRKSWCKRRVWIPGGQEPIVADGVWDEYLHQWRLRRHLPPRVEGPKYTLTGLLRCGRCQGPLNATGARKGKPGYLYACASYTRAGTCPGTWVARHRLEEVVLEWLSLSALEIDQAAQMEAKRLQAAASASDDLGRLEGELGRLERRLGRLTVLLADEGIGQDAYDAAVGDIRQRRAEVTHAIDSAREARTRAARPPSPAVTGLLGGWGSMEAHDRRALLSHLVRVITVQSHGLGSPVSVEITSTWGQVYFYSI